MIELSELAMRAYRALVYDDPRFVEFFRAITPIGEISRLNIGSPTGVADRVEPHRGPAGDPLGVRLVAVPAVDSGLVRRGHRVRRARRRRHAGPRRCSSRCIERWPFFRSIMDNMGMVLAKTDLQIGRRYAELVDDVELRDRRDGTRSPPSTSAPCGWHATITGSADLLADNPTLARSVANRFPYLDPLHVLQVEMLRRYRAGDTDELVARALELTINAIATGLRNSG